MTRPLPAKATERLHPRRRRQEVLRVAAELFADRGYEATSTTEIAAALGIKGGSVYYYFDTKEGLLFELVQDVYGILAETVRDVLAGDGDALEKLRRLIQLHVEEMAREPIRGGLILNETRSLSPEHQAWVAERVAAYERTLVDLVEQGQRAGVIVSDLDPRLVSKALLGAGNWVQRWYREGGAWSPEDVASHYVRLFLGGLAS